MPISLTFTKAEIEAAYSDGRTLVSAAKRLGCSVGGLKARMRQLDVAIRAGGRQPRLLEGFDVYALYDPRVPEMIRYIGFSKDAPSRLGAHIHEARCSAAKSHRLGWIRKLLREGVTPKHRVLVVVQTQEEATRIEIGLIRAYIASGARLVNGTEGGEGLRLTPEAFARRVATQNSPEVVARRSELSRASWADEETRARHREGLKAFHASDEGKAWAEKQREFVKAQYQDPNYAGGMRTPEARAKRAASAVGLKQNRTPEWNAKIAASNLGKTHNVTPEGDARRLAALKSQETRDKMRASALARWEREQQMGLKRETTNGRQLSEEHRAKLSAALKGKPKSPEHAAKVGAATKGRQFSVEHRAKLSATKEAYWEAKRNNAELEGMLPEYLACHD